ncbi:hypothetical protein [Pantoea sp. UBA5035]|uniref:hypothetical protein n=1 Tax=Pantoea sp. UBA5035 TaxID=1947035 RepID=UPI00257BA727|nr:hypothetical protein [Pantoea sp. UBA5035]
MSENNQLTPADDSATAPALLRTCINPADIDLFQAAVFYRDPTLLALFSLTPDEVQLKDQLAVMGKFTADRNAQRRHEQSKVNKQLKGLTDQIASAEVTTSTNTVTKSPPASATPTFQRHAGLTSQFAPKAVA